jgi:hypothetical protein
MNLADIDILDPGAYLAGPPHDRFAILRREAPVFWHKEPGGRGFWAVTRHAFEELLRRLPDMELAGPVVRLRSNWIAGIKAMPVRFAPS